ncbi:hypothetical protein M9Y10_039716 [Tritrichomonas musculus]|uniref:DUF4201 domain-containing protein n=1 Tax=Tritrichomonas musculus TaxID=1915356 RepID=A0ABR2GRX7_9EUKA
MTESDSGESNPSKDDENLTKTFETTANTLFGSINDDNNDENQNNDNQEKKDDNLDQNINDIVENDDISVNDTNKAIADIKIDQYQENEDQPPNKEDSENKENNDDSKEFDKSNQSEPKLEIKIENSQTQTPQPSDNSKKNKDEIASMCNEILNGNKDPLSIEFEDTLSVLTYITRYRNDKMALHEVDEAEKSDYIIAKIIHNYKDTLKSINRSQKEQIIKNKLQKAEKRLQQAQDHTNRSISELKAQNHQTLQHLKIKHNQEFENLFYKFNSPAVQRHYTQASSHLRTLRYQMQLLQNSNRFDELKIAQQSVAMEEQREIDEVTHSISSQFQAQVKLLEEKHQAEVESRQISFEDKETRLRIVCGRKTDALQNHINNIMADLQMLQKKQKESSQVIMQKGEMMLKISKATASRPTTSLQKNKNFSSSSTDNNAKKGETSLIASAAETPDIFSLKLPPLSRSHGIKQKREKLNDSYKA